MEKHRDTCSVTWIAGQSYSWRLEHSGNHARGGRGTYSNLQKYLLTDLGVSPSTNEIHQSPAGVPAKTSRFYYRIPGNATTITDPPIPDP
jgi:hypothetical protein